MSDDRWAWAGATAGAVGVGLYVTAALVIGDRPDFDAGGLEVAAWFDEERTRIQVAAALNGAATAFLVWFLSTVFSLVRETSAGAARAATAAFGFGLIFCALFLADLTALAVGALRPENMAADPELAAALVDFEWLAQGLAALMAVGALCAFALLGLRERAIWPAWIGRLAVLAAVAYAPRVGTVFTTEGVFAADGLLGLYVPVGAFAGWILVASLVLARSLRPAPD